MKKETLITLEEWIVAAENQVYLCAPNAEYKRGYFNALSYVKKFLEIQNKKKGKRVRL